MGNSIRFFERRKIVILPLLLSYFDSFILISAPAVQTALPGTTFPLLLQPWPLFPLPFASYVTIRPTLATAGIEGPALFPDVLAFQRLSRSARGLGSILDSMRNFGVFKGFLSVFA